MMTVEVKNEFFDCGLIVNRNGIFINFFYTYFGQKCSKLRGVYVTINFKTKF